VLLLLRATLLLRLRPLLRTQALLLRLLLRLRAQASKLSRRVRLRAKTASGNRLGFPSSKTKRHGLTSVAFCHSGADFVKALAQSKPVIATTFGFEALLLKRGY
jgi:hypothetical protein